MRFSKGVRYFVSAAFVLNGLLYIPIILYVPSLMFSEGKFHSVCISWFLEWGKRSDARSRKFHSIQFHSTVTGYNVHVVNTIVCYCCVFYTLLVSTKEKIHSMRWASDTFLVNFSPTGWYQSSGVDWHCSRSRNGNITGDSRLLWNAKSRWTGWCSNTCNHG